MFSRRTVRMRRAKRCFAKPVTLDATFIGAGTNPNSKKLNIGFRATAGVKRSDFGLGLAAPVVSDNVDLVINAAFQSEARRRWLQWCKVLSIAFLRP